MSVNTKIKHLMKQQGITQNALAAKLGITQAALSNMLSGDNQIRRRTLDKIAFALGKTAEDFLDNTSVEELSGRVEQLEKTLNPFKVPQKDVKRSLDFSLLKNMRCAKNTETAAKAGLFEQSGKQACSYGDQDMEGFFYTLLQKALSRIERLEKEVSELKSQKTKKKAKK